MANPQRGVFVKKDGAWQEVTIPSVKVNGVWTPVRQGFVKVNGVWKHFYPHSGSMNCPSAGTYTMQVAPGIYQLTINASAGGGGGGTIMDGGYNDDNGSSGGGSSGQMVRNFSIAVTPGETVSITVGAGGGPGARVRDGNDTGQPGGDTTISCTSGTYVLRGGVGGGGGSPAGGGNFSGGSYIRVNASIPSVFGSDGTSRYGLLSHYQLDYSYSGYNAGSFTGGSAAEVQARYDALPTTISISTEDGSFNATKRIDGGPYASYYTVGGKGGANFNGAAADGTNNTTGRNGTLGGGGSGVYSGYLREDRGIPGFSGGAGGDGFAQIYWGPGVDPNYPT